jgi:cytochrome c oxidase cbb3-type subunit 3
VSSPRLGCTVAWLAAALLVCACEGDDVLVREWTAADHGQPAQADPARVATQAQGSQAEPDRPANPAEARRRAILALYNVSCASCHGRSGRGDGPAMPAGMAAPDFTDPEWQAERTDEELALTIRQGRGVMPAFGDRIPPQGVSTLVGLVRIFGGRMPGRGESPHGGSPEGAEPAGGDTAPAPTAPTGPAPTAPTPTAPD